MKERHPRDKIPILINTSPYTITINGKDITISDDFWDKKSEKEIIEIKKKAGLIENKITLKDIVHQKDGGDGVVPVGIKIRKIREFELAMLEMLNDIQKTSYEQKTLFMVEPYGIAKVTTISHQEREALCIYPGIHFVTIKPFLICA